MIPFDEHIFQLGWNHQLDLFHFNEFSPSRWFPYTYYKRLHQLDAGSICWFPTRQQHQNPPTRNPKAFWVDFGVTNMTRNAVDGWLQKGT